MRLKIAVSAVLFAVLWYPAIASGQAGPQSGSSEVQAWTGGGHGLNGTASGTGVWNLGFRYGWVLTDPIGPGPLRGRFEYTVDAAPAFVITQRNGTAYALGLTPVGLKWNFSSPRRVVPYFQIDGGLLFSNTEVPPGTNKVNFTPSGALGVHFPRGKFNWSAELRFMHISNAGLATPNPGINTLQVRLGFGLFSRER